MLAYTLEETCETKKGDENGRRTEHLSLVTVFHLQSKNKRTYLLKRKVVVDPKAPPCGKSNEKPRKMERKAWMAWSRSHPIQNLVNHRLSPGHQYSYSRKVKHPNHNKLEFISIKKGNKTLFEKEFDSSDEAFGQKTSTHVLWTPDGHSALLVRKTTGTITMRGPLKGTINIKIFRLAHMGRFQQKPRVQLFANAGFNKLLARKIANKIRADGFRITRIYKAKVTRKRTTIYKARGFQKVARRLVKWIPGGVLIKALSWKSPYKVVLALGRSAEGSIKKKVAVQVFANVELMSSVAPKLSKVLSLAGYKPTSRIWRSKVTRNITTIYAASGYESTAQHIASLLPGGADIQPRLWKSRYPLVLAIGTSARSK